MGSKKEGIVVVSKQVQYVIVEVKVAEDHRVEGSLPSMRAACSAEQRQLVELKNQIGKVDFAAWEEAKAELDGAIKTVLDMVTALRLDFDAQCRKMDGTHDAIRQDITAAKAYLEETKAKVTGDTDQAMKVLNGRFDFTNKELAATQENLHATQKSLSDYLNGIAVVKSELERNVADAEVRLKVDIRLCQQEALSQGEKMREDLKAEFGPVTKLIKEVLGEKKEMAVQDTLKWIDQEEIHSEVIEHDDANHSKEGTPPDQWRLIDAGKQLEVDFVAEADSVGDDSELDAIKSGFWDLFECMSAKQQRKCQPLKRQYLTACRNADANGIWKAATEMLAKKRALDEQRRR